MEPRGLTSRVRNALTELARVRGRFPGHRDHDFKEHANACGMGHLTFHQLRHGAASLLIAQG